MIQDMEVAATEEGKLLGVRVKLQADMGAYASLVGPGIPILGAFHYHGVYDCDAYSFSCTSVFTNRTPTDSATSCSRPGPSPRTWRGGPGQRVSRLRTTRRTSASEVRIALVCVRRTAWTTGSRASIAKSERLNVL